MVEGKSCNQPSFKTGKTAFLDLGPGAKGQGYKAMFKLAAFRAQAEKLATKDPERFGVGSTSWVTTRFTREKPLPQSIWRKWLTESYGLSSEATTTAKKKKSAKKSKRG